MVFWSCAICHVCWGLGWKRGCTPKLEMGSISRWSPGPTVTLKYNQPDLASWGMSTGNQVPWVVGTGSSTTAVLLSSSTAPETAHTGRSPVLLCLPERSISTTPPTLKYTFQLLRRLFHRKEKCTCLLSWHSPVAQNWAGNGNERQCNKYKNRIGLLELFYIK